MSSQFKRIAKPGEALWEQVSEDPTVFYRWVPVPGVTPALPKNQNLAEPPDGYTEQFWSFTLWALTIDRAVQTFEIRFKEGVCVEGAAVARRHVRFPDLDQATVFVNKEIMSRVEEGYRTIRYKSPFGDPGVMNHKDFAGAL